MQILVYRIVPFRLFISYDFTIYASTIMAKVNRASNETVQMFKITVTTVTEEDV